MTPISASCKRSAPDTAIIGVLLLGGWCAAAQAQMTRTDKLECAVKDGVFLLESKYRWSVVQIPGRPNRESDRQGWKATYRDASGRKSVVPAGVMFSNRKRKSLEEACSHFGLLHGVPVAPYTYLNKDGRWGPAADFPWEKLDVAHLENDSVAHSERRDRLAQQGYQRAAYSFAFIAPVNGQLIYEQPLYRPLAGYVYGLKVDAVFQASSSDDGATWSEGKLTTEAKLFDIGKSRVEQSRRAIPVRLNGKPLAD